MGFINRIDAQICKGLGFSHMWKESWP